MEGNQLAVFLDAADVSSEKMQTIAREMNLSESTFITGRHKDENGVESFSTRIFTKEEELPFAGHPTLGTAFLIHTLHNMNTVNLDLAVGRISVSFENHEKGSFGEMRQNEPTFGSVHDRGAIAKILDVEISEIEDDLPIQTVSTGNPFIIVPIKRLSVLRKMFPNYARMDAYLRKSDARFMYLVTKDTEKTGAILRARMIYYGGEDPATGSAAGPATAWMLANGTLSPDTLAWIDQGKEVNRPSRLYVRGSMANGIPSNIRVGGNVHIVAKGEILG